MATSKRRISSPPSMEWIVCGLSAGFPAVSPTTGQVLHVLLTRPPLEAIASRSTCMS